MVYFLQLSGYRPELVKVNLKFCQVCACHGFVETFARDHSQSTSEHKGEGISDIRGGGVYAMRTSRCSECYKTLHQGNWSQKFCMYANSPR